jgi:KDO2-lipid IV(A) lauroyltransferase
LGKFLFKIFVLPLIYLLSILPLWLLHLKSYGLYFFVFYVFGYRKKVVYENLRNSFPSKSEEEINKIAKDFYLHFCDVIFETIKLLTMSQEAFRKHFQFDESAVKIFSGFESEGRSMVGVMGHCGNWEWGAIAFPTRFKTLITGVYHPLSDKNFDALMLKLRSRFGGNIIPMSRVYKEMLTLKQKNVPTLLGLIADQTPPPEGAYWTKFLNQDTPVFNGTEKIARKFNYPVIYVPLHKVKRGYYTMGAVLITEKPAEMPEGMISELHTRELEKNILEQPHAWLWTHRRWKHRR